MERQTASALHWWPPPVLEGLLFSLLMGSGHFMYVTIHHKPYRLLVIPSGLFSPSLLYTEFSIRIHLINTGRLLLGGLAE